MQTIQDFLTMTIVVLCATITITIALDLCVNLTQLWNNVANNVQDVQQVYVQFNSENKPESRLTAKEMKTISIKDKIDGSYQKVGILRAQLQEKLKSQQSEVEQVLSHLC